MLRTRRGQTDDGPPPPDDTATRRVAAFSAALAPAPKGTVRGHRVEVERGTDGTHRYTFRGVSEAELEGFARAVLANL